jgi:hypothetical protein
VTSVQKLSRIVLICRQAERLAEFYIRAFGFACIEDSPKIDPGFAELIGLAKGQVRITSLRLGNQEIALAETQPPRMHLSGRCSWMGSAVSAFRDCSVRYGSGLCEFAGPSYLDGHLNRWPANSAASRVTAFKFRDPEGHPLEMLAFALARRLPIGRAGPATPVWASIIPQFQGLGSR